MIRGCSIINVTAKPTASAAASRAISPKQSHILASRRAAFASGVRMGAPWSASRSWSWDGELPGVGYIVAMQHVLDAREYKRAARARAGCRMIRAIWSVRAKRLGQRSRPSHSHYQKAAVRLATTAASAIEPVPSPPLLKLGCRRAASDLLMFVSI